MARHRLQHDGNTHMPSFITGAIFGRINRCTLIDVDKHHFVTIIAIIAQMAVPWVFARTSLMQSSYLLLQYHAIGLFSI